MRVTKLIRDYVESEVRAKYEKKRQTVGEEYQALKNKIDAEVQAIVDEANEKAYDIVSKAGFVRTYDKTSKKVIESNFGAFAIPTELDKIRKEREELFRKECETINSILISLEIGEASKDELKGILDALEV